MTTDGGGWILTYIVKNDHGNAAPNWFPFLAKGGSSFPKNPSSKPKSAWYEGPSLSVRSALWANVVGKEYRSVTYDNSGNVILDFKTSAAQDNKNTWFCAAAGCGGGSPKSGYGNKVISTMKSLGTNKDFKKGQTVSFYQLGAYGCNCWESMHAGSSSKGPMLFGK